MRYDRSTWERWYLYGKSSGLGTGGTNGEIVSGWRAVPSAEVVKGGESVKGPRLCGVVLWHGVTWCNLNRTVMWPVGVSFQLLSYLTLQPLKMDLTEGSETSAIINQTPGNYPKESLL